MVRQSTLFLLCVVHPLGLLAAAELDPQVVATQPGVRMTMIAEHPDLATPTGIDVDSQGRIWVVATHTHMRPDDYKGPIHDEILVFDMTNRQTPVRRVFYNATSATMDLELGADGWVYLAERDRILRIKDTDDDGVADVEEDLVVLTSEAVYPHNGLSGLAWHPDGDLLFGLGENFAKPWKLAGADGKAIHGAAQGGVFRCSVDGKKLHWVAKGLWNPFGLCVRDDGEIFAAENDPGERPPCRLLHIVEGGEYGYRRQYGPEAHHPFVCWNGELPGTLPMVHPTGEAPCGVLPLGRGVLVPSWGDHRIDFLPLRKRGASYEADLVTLAKGGRYFRPTCIAQDLNVGGSKRVWYLADWVDGRYNAHGLGRLWKLEIDLNKATWVGPLDLEPPTKAAKLAIRLRRGDASHNVETLRQLASDKDPFVARAALMALSRDTVNWSPDKVGQWPSRDRAQAVMALHLARSDPDKWLPMFLADSAEVRFQALRWIADLELKQFLADVEAVLNSSDINYTLFEAALAAWNTLKGKPEAGIHDIDALLARVRDADSSPRLRAYALRLLPTQPRAAAGDVGSLPARKFPNGVSLQLLRELLAVDDSELSLEVVRAAAGNSGDAQRLLLEIAGDEEQPANLRAEAVAGLASAAPSHTDTLLKLANDDRRAVRREAVRCLRTVPLSGEQKDALRALAQRHPESSNLITAVLAPDSLKANRPAPSDIKAWLQMLDEVPGAADVENGRRIFHHDRVGTCSHCHRHSGRGNTVGPDLTLLSQRATREWLLTSILDPSREMAPEYQPRTLVLNDGRSFTGIRLRSYTREQIRDAHGQTRTFDRGDVESIMDSSVSFMPTGLVDMLTTRELRDLLAFLIHSRDANPLSATQVGANSNSDDRAMVMTPLVRTVDLNVGETQTVRLSNGKSTKIKLLNLKETRDPIRQAVRSAKVTVEVDGQEITLESGMYNLPLQVADAQVDCPVTSGCNTNGTPAFWGLDKAARLRVWPAESPLTAPGSFIYPVDQRWFATRTWFDNEPVDGGAKILPKIYYHSGLDIGASEAQVRVLAATKALVVSVGDDVLAGHDSGTPVAARYDVVYLMDRRGWYYRYSHLHQINNKLLPGRFVDQGTEIGLVGKRGASGGWSHLHFEIKNRQPSGKWGTQAGYAFLWEAYRNQYKPALVANSRRKSFLLAGEAATLDATKSWSATDSIHSYEWTFSDGSHASGPTVSRVYSKPGFYSEILKVTDKAGHVDYDFAEVHVVDPKTPNQYAPGIHAVYWPTFNNRVNLPITFKVRSFREPFGEEVWDFGDGSPPVRVKSDGNVDPLAKDGYAVTQHTYRQPGHYLVRVQRRTASGQIATARLHVRVAAE